MSLIRKDSYSLRRRIQFWTFSLTVLSMMIVTVGAWLADHYLNYHLVLQVQGEVVSSLQNLTYGGATQESMRASQTRLDRIAERNPSLWYYFESGSSILHHGRTDPSYKHRLIGDGVRILGDGDGEQPCDRAGTFFLMPPGNDAQVVRLRDCAGRHYYFEIGGIERGLSFADTLVDGIKYRYVEGDRYQRSFVPVLLVALALVGIVTMVLGSFTGRIREVSQVARKLGTGKHHVALPQHDLPVEIRPMVHAINQGIARLEEVSEQKSLFLAAAAHELRTPLAVHRSRLEKMPDGELKDQLCQDVRYMASMISQLLALAELGGASKPLEKLKLASVVEEVCANRVNAALKAGVDLSFESADEAGEIVGDQATIRIAVANLIDNAIAFSPEGAAVEVAVREGRVTVRDRGPGVADDVAEHIFEPFFKSPSNKRGHGLGLAIVSEIARINNGAIATRNEPDGGAVFELTFQQA